MNVPPDRASAGTGVFNNIVVGIDGTPASDQAMRLAVRLRADDGRLLGISVAETHLATRTGLEAAQWTSAIRAAAEEVRARWADELEHVPGAHVRAVDGRAAELLLGELKRGDADLVAVGAGGGGRTAGFIFGSTATLLAREAPCSVLISRESIDATRFPERIVVGIDGSAPSASAEALALALGDSYEAHVRRLMATGGEHLHPERMVRGELDARHPVEALVDASSAADLLVVGSRGLRGLAALGSVAERVAHRAACPVLIVRDRP